MDVTHISYFIPDSQAVFFHCPYNLSTTLDYQIEAQPSLILKYDEWTKFQNNFTANNQQIHQSQSRYDSRTNLESLNIS